MPPPTGPSDEDIVAILRLTRPAMRQLFHRYRIQIQDAEDIVQQSLVVLVRRVAEAYNPNAFFLGTVRRKITRHLRRRAAERLVQLADEHMEQLTVDSPAELIERRRDAQRLLKLLPPTTCQIALLHLGAGYKHQEIAEALDLSETAVRQLLSRGLRQLRSELAVSTAAHATVPACPDPAPPAAPTAPARP